MSDAFLTRAQVFDRQLEYQQGCRYNLSAGLRAAHVKRLCSPYLTAGIERYGRIAAACSVENRSPLLDKRVVELCVAMPWQQKVRTGWSKVVLRNLAERVVPASVAFRRDNDHVGWDFTSKWMTMRGAEIKKLLATIEADQVECFSREKYASLTKDFDTAVLKASAPQLWRIINLINWKQQNFPAGKHS